jgi:hypothetical protein
MEIPKQNGGGWMWVAWFLSLPVIPVVGAATALYFALPFEIAWWRLAVGAAGVGWLIQKAVKDGIDEANVQRWSEPVREALRQRGRMRLRSAPRWRPAQCAD